VGKYQKVEEVEVEDGSSTDYIDEDNDGLFDVDIDTYLLLVKSLW